MLFRCYFEPQSSLTLPKFQWLIKDQNKKRKENFMLISQFHTHKVYIKKNNHLRQQTGAYFFVFEFFLFIPFHLKLSLISFCYIIFSSLFIEKSGEFIIFFIHCKYTVKIKKIIAQPREINPVLEKETFFCRWAPLLI